MSWRLSGRKNFGCKTSLGRIMRQLHFKSLESVLQWPLHTMHTLHSSDKALQGIREHFYVWSDQNSERLSERDICWRASFCFSGRKSPSMPRWLAWPRSLGCDTLHSLVTLQHAVNSRLVRRIEDSVQVWDDAQKLKWESSVLIGLDTWTLCVVMEEFHRD